MHICDLSRSRYKDRHQSIKVSRRRRPSIGCKTRICIKTPCFRTIYGQMIALAAVSSVFRAYSVEKNEVSAQSPIANFESKRVFRRTIPSSGPFDVWKLHDDDR